MSQQGFGFPEPVRTTVVNVRRHWDLVEQAKREGRYVAVHRPSKWGNPFTHLENSLAQFRVASRDEAIDRFEAWLHTQPELLAAVKTELKGKVLGCFCKPKDGFKGKVQCHGQILAGLADGVPPHCIP